MSKKGAAFFQQPLFHHPLDVPGEGGGGDPQAGGDLHHALVLVLAFQDVLHGLKLRRGEEYLAAKVVLLLAAGRVGVAIFDHLFHKVPVFAHPLQLHPRSPALPNHLVTYYRTFVEKCKAGAMDIHSARLADIF